MKLIHTYTLVSDTNGVYMGGHHMRCVASSVSCAHTSSNLFSGVHRTLTMTIVKAPLLCSFLIDAVHSLQISVALMSFLQHCLQNFAVS